MSSYFRALSILLVAALVLGIGLAPRLSADDDDDDDDDRNVVELEDAAVFIEWNSTDTDFGIQFFWDGEGWTKMKVKNEDGDTVLKVKTYNNVKDQSLTEAMFESREPPASELSMKQFLKRFPEGEYEFSGKTFEGDKLVGEADFSHTLAEPTEIVSPEADSVQDSDGFTIEWTEVTEDLDGNEIEVEFYVVVLENTGDDEATELEIVVPGDADTELEIPAQFITPESTYKVEIIVQEAESGNRTITESGEFETD
jgi:hypothetical protein